MTLGPIRTRIISLRDISELKVAWSELQERSAEDNAYYTSHYASSLLETVEKKREVKFVTTWLEKKLVGLLPIVLPKVFIPGLRAVGRAWQTPYTFSCTPLLDQNVLFQSAIALIDALSKLKKGEWVIPNINVDGTVYSALREAMAMRNIPSSFINLFERASLPIGDSYEHHMDTHVSSKLRRDMARKRRRLDECGEVSFESHNEGQGLENAVDQFLRIEASGWKGERGTALACSEDSKLFANRVFKGGIAGYCRADILKLNNETIAVALMIKAGRTAFTVKNSYDEKYSTFSPGLLLEIEIIRRLLGDKGLDKLDSGTNGKHVIDGFWPGRIKVADLVFSTSEHFAKQRLILYCASATTTEQFKLRLKKTLKSD